jgi:threonine/homoserine/homoserine lactone efflux protein
MSGDLGAFLVVATIVVITPGVDMAVVTRNAILDGRRAAVLTALGSTSLTSYALLAARGRNVLRRPAVERTLDRATGIVLIGLGVRLALERRP